MSECVMIFTLLPTTLSETSWTMCVSRPESAVRTVRKSHTGIVASHLVGPGILDGEFAFCDAAVNGVRACPGLVMQDDRHKIRGGQVHVESRGTQLNVYIRSKHERIRPEDLRSIPQNSRNP